MRDIEISKPMVAALVAALLFGAFMLYNSTKSDDGALPPPAAVPTGSTGASGATNAHGATGATGASGETKETDAERRARKRKKEIAAAKEAGIPLKVYQAREAGKEIAIFFWEPRASDDKRTNEALKAVEKKRPKLVIFRDRIGNKSKYDGIAQAAEVTQTPAIVLVYGDKADLWQGYIDSGTLNERIANLHD